MNVRRVRLMAAARKYLSFYLYFGFVCCCLCAAFVRWCDGGLEICGSEVVLGWGGRRCSERGRMRGGGYEWGGRWRRNSGKTGRGPWSQVLSKDVFPRSVPPEDSSYVSWVIDQCKSWYP